MNNNQSIAYFSMEIGLDAKMPTYSGGLGILAGDTVRAAADLKVPMVAVTLLYRKGYFVQQLGPDGWQTESPVAWAAERFLEEMPARASVSVEGRTVQVRAWKYAAQGVSGHEVPVFFLDSDLPENEAGDRTLTHYLYGGDSRYRLAQEIVLGIGGVRMLRALGFEAIERFHMNEGHSSLLTLELLDERVRAAGRNRVAPEDVEEVRRQCVFTTHTPVAAGHDRFPLDLVERVVSHTALSEMGEVFCWRGELNMTYLALNLSHYVNGVAKRHGEVSRHLFGHYVIDSITNGVHPASWTAPPFQELFDRYIPGWREDAFSLRYALAIPPAEVWAAHAISKRQLLERVNRETSAGMDPDVLTLGFARRAAAYKRPDLLFHDLERLRAIVRKAGRVQVIFAGKAHPQDTQGKELIKSVYRAGAALRDDLRVAYLSNYDIELGRQLTAGVDIWLNTPQPPLEASGTSGMKAALNGVPSLSILDGWWLEGCIEGITGWAIGGRRLEDEPGDTRAADGAALCEKLEQVVPLFYGDRPRFTSIMLHAIALNGSFFNTHRMMQQYVTKAYFE